MVQKQPRCVECRPRNPMRHPHWRWGIGKWLVAIDSRPLSRWHDRPWGARVIAYHLAITQSSIHPDGTPIDPELASLHAAHKLWSDPAYHWDRVVLESRILAGESPDVLAARTGLPPEVLEAYMQVFFDARPRLSRSTFILHCVIGLHLRRRSTEDGLPVLLRLFAYYGGPHVLDAFLSLYREVIRPVQVTDSAFNQSIDSSLALLIKVVVATHCSEYDPRLQAACEPLAEAPWVRTPLYASIQGKGLDTLTMAKIASMSCEKHDLIAEQQKHEPVELSTAVLAAQAREESAARTTAEKQPQLPAKLAKDERENRRAAA